MSMLRKLILPQGGGGGRLPLEIELSGDAFIAVSIVDATDASSSSSGTAPPVTEVSATWTHGA